MGCSNTPIPLSDGECEKPKLWCTPDFANYPRVSGDHKKILRLLASPDRSSILLGMEYLKNLKIKKPVLAMPGMALFVDNVGFRTPLEKGISPRCLRKTPLLHCDTKVEGGCVSMDWIGFEHARLMQWNEPMNWVHVMGMELNCEYTSLVGNCGEENDTILKFSIYQTEWFDKV